MMFAPKEFIFAVLFLSSFVVAQDGTSTTTADGTAPSLEVSQCIIDCISEASGVATCDSADLTCVCNNQVFTDAVTACLVNNCPAEESTFTALSATACGAGATTSAVPTPSGNTTVTSVLPSTTALTTTTARPTPTTLTTVRSTTGTSTRSNTNSPSGTNSNGTTEPTGQSDSAIAGMHIRFGGLLAAVTALVSIFVL